MNDREKELDKIIGKKILKAEWKGGLSIDDGEGYLLTLEDGSKILFSYYHEYDCSGSAFEIIEKDE